MLYSAALTAFLLGAASSSARPLYVRQSASFGSCGSPEVQFANGLDGRNESSFQAVNQADFNHGSALNIGVISSFICQQLNDKCKASAAQIAACTAGQTAAAALTGGASADAFNAALGIKSNFATGAVSASATPAAAAATTSAAAAASTSPAASTGSTAAATGALSFGTCTDPSVKFGAGLDGRKATEFSFLPNNQADFAHGSALNPDIIFQFICDTFVNKCGLKQTDATVTTCRAAQKTADALGKVGAAADSFNAALGITTDFAALETATASAPAAVAATASAAVLAAASSPASVCVASTSTVTVTAASTATASAAPAAATDAASTAPAASGSVDFGSCTDPSVKFGAGLDGRKATEFSFLPNNQADFAHGSALNPDIIFQFICDTFVNKCGFKQTDATVTTCRAAQKTADALGKTGAAADSFNAALGITTDFAALSTAVVASPTASAAAGAATDVAAAAPGGALSFGTCTDPSVKFGAGLDGRKATEFSFINNNQADFTHGSALNPDIIFQFTCDTFVNKCGLTQTDATVTTCRAAQKTADALGKTGAAADSFNAALGIKTNFAAVSTTAPAAA